MKPETLILVAAAFLVYSPVLDIGGHFVYPPELFIYLVGALKLTSVLVGRRNLGTTARPWSSAVRAHVGYFVLFLMSAALSAYLAREMLNNYDIFVLRHILQVIICIYVFGDMLDRIGDIERLDRLSFRLIVVLSFPAAIVYIQRYDLFGLRDVLYELYKPQFFSKPEILFRDYRYTSIFKDFFTAAVYFTMLASYIFYYLLRTRLGFAYRVVLIGLLTLVYVAQLFVARSSLVAIPVLLGAIAILSMGGGFRFIVTRLVPLGLAAVLVASVGVKTVFESGLVNQKWAIEALHFVDSSKRDRIDSVARMRQWGSQTLRQAEMRGWLLNPRHSYTLTEQRNPGLYSDSFYSQEVYRYGIYGMVAYSVYVIWMLGAHWGRNRFIFLLVGALAVLNIKGGNTFFMTKNIYLYALLLAITPYLGSRKAS